MEKENSDSDPLYDNTIFVNRYLLLHTQEHIMSIRLAALLDVARLQVSELTWECHCVDISQLGATEMAGNLPSSPLPDIQLLPIVLIGMWNYFDWLNYLMRPTNCLPFYYDGRANAYLFLLH
uniref:Uncharacterized protein n=1 Tax=Glossina pallidipes TaxID=7398 RepID=A0A1A9ZEE1_GLOPL